MPAADFDKATTAAREATFSQQLKHKVIKLDGFVSATQDGKYINHTCVALEVLLVTPELQLAASVQGPPPSASRLALSSVRA